MNNYFVFTDEAGVYQSNPSASHIQSHPFYIRSNVLMAIDDYRQYQFEMQRINGEFEIPFDQEIKWSDLWSKTKNKSRNTLIDQMPFGRLKNYYRRILKTATAKKSLCFLFTVTDIVGKTCDLNNNIIYRCHLQDAFQRIQMDMRSDKSFAIFVMDDLNASTISKIKSACHTFTVLGDFVNYKNLYHGILVENSLYSLGIQLADYAAGIMNGFLRGKLVRQGKYKFATDLYNEYIKPRLRSHSNGTIVGYGVVDVPRRTAFRNQLETIFNQTRIDKVV